MSRYIKQIEEIITKAEEQAFQKGWEAAKLAFNASLETLKAGSKPIPNPKWLHDSQRERPLHTTRRTKRARREKSGGRLKELIRQNPGRTGAQLIEMMAPMNGRTIRTALRRMKLKGEIEKRGEGWFAI